MQPIGHTCYRHIGFGILKIKDRVIQIMVVKRLIAPLIEMLWKLTLTSFIDKLVPHIALIEGIGKMDDCPHGQRHLYNRNWFSAN